MPAIESIQSYVLERSVTTDNTSFPGGVAISLKLKAPLPPAVFQAVDAEWQWCTNHPNRLSVIMPQTLTVLDRGQTILATIVNFDEQSIQLANLLEAFHSAGSPLGRQLAAWLIGATANQLYETVHQYHRVDGDLSPRDIWVSPNGEVAIFAPAAPLLRRLIIPRHPQKAYTHHLAPEVQGSEQLSPATDVYALAAIYCELLKYPPTKGTEDPSSPQRQTFQATVPFCAKQLPEPQDNLLPFLARCFHANTNHRPPHGAAFFKEMLRELTASGYPPPERSIVGRLIQEYVPSAIPRGAHTLEGDAMPNGLGHAAVSETSETSMVTIVDHRPAHLFSHTSDSAWADILGDELQTATSSNSPGTAKRAPETKLKLPLPQSPSPNISVSLPSPTASPMAETARPVLATEKQTIAELRPTKVPPAPTLEDAVRMPSSVVWTIIGLPTVVIGGILLIASQRSPVPPPIGTVKHSLIPHQPTSSASLEPVSSPPARPIAGSSAPSVDQRPVVKPPGLVTVISNPSGATVFINGDYVGKTPLVLRHTLRNRRRYAVEIVHHGYESWSQSVWAKNGALNLVAHLVPKPRQQ